MLHGEAAAERRYTVDGLLRDSFGVIEEPVDFLRRDVLVDLLEYVQDARDGFVVGRVQSSR